MTHRSRVLTAVAGLASGGAAAVAASRPTLVEWPTPVRVVVPAVSALVVGGTAAGLVGAVSSALPGTGGIAPTDPVPGGASPAGRRALTALAAAAALVSLAVGARVVRRRVVRALVATGRSLEPGFRASPTDPMVSGGPGSLVPYASVGREGARFVSLPAPPGAILEVTGSPALAAPIRVFVGLDAAPTPVDRVDLAMAELLRTGAFDRAVLVVVAPAGSGFANSTPVEVVELLTRGDCAAVSVGYGLLPSFLSLDRVDVATRTQRLLLEAVAAEWARRPSARRPRILLYGESLGAKVQQGALPGGAADLDDLHVSAALWVGTPGGAPADAFHAAVRPVSATVDRPDQVPAAVREPYPRVWFLEHDGDPVVRFRPRVLLARPDWLDRRPRGRNVPDAMVWAPGITWLQLLVDTVFATNVRPGEFQSKGHDYREDLGTVVAAAFGLSVNPLVHSRLEVQLRQAEVERAARVAEPAGPG